MLRRLRRRRRKRRPAENVSPLQAIAAYHAIGEPGGVQCLAIMGASDHAEKLAEPVEFVSLQHRSPSGEVRRTKNVASPSAGPRRRSSAVGQQRRHTSIYLGAGAGGPLMENRPPAFRMVRLIRAIGDNSVHRPTVAVLHRSKEDQKIPGASDLHGRHPQDRPR
jgi:hypothetical protein